LTAPLLSPQVVPVMLLVVKVVNSSKGWYERSAA